MNGAVYIAFRVEDLPVPHAPSERRPCERCRRELWVDPVSLGSVIEAEGSEPIVLCFQCAAPIGDVDITVTPTQMELIRAHLARR
jgi:hypothetical protein